MKPGRFVDLPYCKLNSEWLLQLPDQSHWCCWPSMWLIYDNLLRNPLNLSFDAESNVWRKSKLSLCFTNYAPCDEDVGESGGIAWPFLTSALDGSEWLAERPSRSAPYTQCIEGCMGSRVGLDAVEKRNVSCPCQKSNSGHPALKQN
jgi:hypothetical protein